MTVGCGERAHARGALSHLRCLLRRLPYLLALFGTPALAVPACPADRSDAKALVAHVYDGDTLLLRNGRQLRLIGIDTPELGHDGAPDQPYAADARDALRQRLPDQARITLRYDVERQDMHGRTLAHGFFADGGSISAWLLDQGLATLLILPPDTWNADCYAAAERRAREARRGIWASPDYQPAASASLPVSTRGYRVVKSRVLGLHEAKEVLWLRLEGRFSVRIDKDNLPAFAAVPLRELLRREVVVRGRVYPVGGELHLKLHHPANLEWAPR